MGLRRKNMGVGHSLSTSPVSSLLHLALLLNSAGSQTRLGTANRPFLSVSNAMSQCLCNDRSQGLLEHTVYFEIIGKPVEKKRVFSWGETGILPTTRRHFQRLSFNQTSVGIYLEPPAHRSLAGSHQEWRDERCQHDSAPLTCSEFSQPTSHRESCWPEPLCFLTHLGGPPPSFWSTWNHLSVAEFLSSPRYSGTSLWKLPWIV